MGTLKVIVRNDALNFMQEVTHWYECTMGRKAAQKFTDDIRNTVSKYRIIYRFTKTTLYIVAIHATMMKH